MKDFTVHCEWVMIGSFKVQAETVEEAIELVQDYDHLPPDGEYLDDSFQVNEDFTLEDN